MPDFLDEHMDAIRVLSCDALVGTGWAKNSKQAWLAYFWMEARNEINKSKFYAYREWYLDFFNHMYVLPQGWDRLDSIPAAPALSLKAGRTWDNANDAILLRMMEACLFTGFERFRGALPDGLPPNDASYQMVKYCEGYGRDKLVRFLWRGEDRSLDEITRVGGLIPKASADFRPANADVSFRTFAETCNLREPWHPFSIPAIRNDYWFRLTSADNCTESVVSVTPDARSALTFPRLGDKNIFFDALPSPARFTGAPVSGQQLSRVTGTLGLPQRRAKNAAGKDIVVPASAAGGGAIRYADKVKLFLCLVEQYFDTAARQRSLRAAGLTEHESFPEYAVKSVPAADIVGAITFVRVFHGTSDADGFTLFYLASESKPPSFARIRDRFVKARPDNERLHQLLTQANTAFDAARALHLKSIKWTASGAVDLAADRKLTGVTPEGFAAPFTQISRIERSAGGGSYTPLWQG
jgi:hypothetical protein